MPERLKSSATRNGTPSKTRLLGHLQRSRRAQKRGKHARKRLFSATLLISGGGIASPIVIRLGARQKRRDWMGPPTLRYQGLDGATHSPVPRKCGWHLSSAPFVGTVTWKTQDLNHAAGQA